MTSTSDFDHAWHEAQFDEACAVLDMAHDKMVDLIASGAWGEAELDRFLLHFVRLPIVHEHLTRFVARVRGEAN